MNNLKNIGFILLYYVIIYIVHYQIQSIYYKTCMSNVIKYYMLKDSNMCTCLISIIKLIEKILFFKIDTFNQHVHQTIEFFLQVI